MRDIKIKVWVDDERMIGPFDLSQNPLYWAGQLEDGHRLLYTGLKDANGTEIYEGDIYENPNGAIFKIYYEVQEAAFLGVSLNRSLFAVPLINMSGATKGRVIGNAFENKELLGEK